MTREGVRYHVVRFTFHNTLDCSHVFHAITTLEIRGRIDDVDCNAEDFPHYSCTNRNNDVMNVQTKDGVYLARKTDPKGLPSNRVCSSLHFDTVLSSLSITSKSSFDRKSVPNLC